MVLRLVPRALELGEQVRARGIHEQRVGRKECGHGEPFALRRFVLELAVHRQHDGKLHRAGGALRRELEVAEILDLVAPELHAHGVCHAERVDVEDATAQRKLRDVLHHGHALEADTFEVLGELARLADVALAKFNAEVRGRRAVACARAVRAAW